MKHAYRYLRLRLRLFHTPILRCLGRTRRAVLTSSEADQRSPLLRSIDRPSAREVRQAAKRAKESFGCWLQGVGRQAFFASCTVTWMEGGRGASEAPG